MWGCCAAAARLLSLLFSCTLQVSEAILENARLMLQTENVQANAEDFKERSEVKQRLFRSLIINSQSICGMTRRRRSNVQLPLQV